MSRDYTKQMKYEYKRVASEKGWTTAKIAEFFGKTPAMINIYLGKAEAGSNMHICMFNGLPDKNNP